MTEKQKELLNQYEVIRNELQVYKDLNIHIDMTRGKPCKEQLDLSSPMLDVISSKSDFRCEEGFDCRNYGVLTGISECKKLFSEIIEVPPSNIIIYGNSSLKIMFDCVSHGYIFGVCGNTPWSKLKKIKWLCPVPGYDRHFAICQNFGIEMINIPLTKNGPDMDLIENLVKGDESIKGIWCVPKYANPDGITYSQEVVKRFANLKPKAKDFRIYWDNAYCLHHFDPNNADVVPEILSECEKAGNPDLVYEFASTSKISFPGSGVAALATSQNNITDITKTLTISTIGYDKINQLRHVSFFKNIGGIKIQMAKHAEILKPKFKLVCDILEKELAGYDIAWFTRPKGGYFISLYLYKGIATRVYNICKEVGINLTQVGSSYPYHRDPDDWNLRLAPSFPSLKELDIATHILALAIKLAAIEKLRNE